MPLCFSMPIIGMGVIADRGPMAGLDNGPAVILALHGLQLLGLLLLLAALNDRAYFSGVSGDAKWLLPQWNLARHGARSGQ